MRNCLYILLLLLMSFFAQSQDKNDKDVYLTILNYFKDSVIGKSFKYTKTVIIDSTSNRNYKPPCFSKSEHFKFPVDTEKVLKLENEFLRSDTVKIDLKNIFNGLSDFKLISNHQLKSIFKVKERKFGKRKFFISEKYLEKQQAKYNRYEKKKSGWRKFYEKFPDSYGYIKLSVIIYSEDKDYAICCIENICGELCGEGLIVILVKINNEWNVCYICSILDS